MYYLDNDTANIWKQLAEYGMTYNYAAFKDACKMAPQKESIPSLSHCSCF